MGGLRFEWDPREAAANLRNHGVSLSEAETVFTDERALLIDDPAHSDDEDRVLLLGLSVVLRLVVVSHSYRRGDTVIRLISAWKATRSERRQYTNR